ncbi:MAG: isocitrate/isopropylmalate family dehydrogenase [Nitrospinota bacterium]|jgi:3-isopropylmalate dehydrogenase|nr:isocitrate/isopropylmalate family dehydrogenase [Nitrospinota bacterium]
MVKIAVVRGDGIANEVMPEAEETLLAAAAAASFPIEFTHFDWGSERYLREGRGMPEDAPETICEGFDALFQGAIGDPRIPGSIVQEQVIMNMRNGLDAYANVRPCRLYHEDLTPLKGRGRGEIDHVIFRENTEGLYANVGGIFKRGTPDEVALQEEVHTYKGVERVIRAAFEFAERHGRRKVTVADKAGGLKFAGPVWRRAWEEVKADFPTIETNAMHVDAVAMELIRHPADFDIVVTENMFGDILSDITSALVGGVGLAPSANLNMGGVSMFEPVHGSAPDIFGQGISNPVAATLTAALLLDHLGCAAGAASIRGAVEGAIEAGERTADIGGRISTRQCGEAIRRRLA